jgi:hypothetical protein
VSARPMIMSSQFCFCYPLLSAMLRGHGHMVFSVTPRKTVCGNKCGARVAIGTGCRLTNVAAVKHFPDAASPQC